ncbi:hypothetical protein ACFPFP_38580 [Bradyrhizobium sp. GCM10023182]|uniref:Uncharacterized protein n=1 Tax=Bradyrhizobium zhengyangense TaxID=2911009 RepID=A0ABS9M0N6_9BRAD|nr:hypothetical protein [Bradyrhizobium zhengyangense]MCG2672820.1 hypothetical protein [Bradyrhizobium zhengyangense]
MQRINISKSIARDPIEKSLCLRYEEVLALREAVRKASSTSTMKRLRRSGNKKAGVNSK